MTTPYASPAGFHRHRCYKCRFVWEHGDENHGVEDAHYCPECGAYNGFHYAGPVAPGQFDAPRHHERSD